MHEYDIVVLDVGLPDVDGFEVCRRMRASGLRPGTSGAMAEMAWQSSNGSPGRTGAR